MKNAPTARMFVPAVLGILTMTAAHAQCNAPAPAIGPAAPAGNIPGFEWHSFAATQGLQGYLVKTDLSGNVLGTNCTNLTYTRITPSGTILAVGPLNGDYVVQESDVANNVIAQWSMNAMNAQLAQFGVAATEQAGDLNHEAIRFPASSPIAGWTAAIAHNYAVVTNPNQCPAAQYPDNTCTVLGDLIIVFDTAGAVRWYWNAFEQFADRQTSYSYLNRPAPLGDTCAPKNNNGGCPVPAGTVAQDWLHANSLYYSPDDGNLVVNLRNQDWLVKLAFANGSGDGHIIWKAGKGGDFTLKNSSQTLWWSHPHDVTSYSAGLWTLFDNGNGRHAQNKNAVSRGMRFSLDETAMVVSILQVFPVQVYSPGSGSAQWVPDPTDPENPNTGAFFFLSGRDINPLTGQPESIGFLFDFSGTLIFKEIYQAQRYRANIVNGFFDYRRPRVD